MRVESIAASTAACADGPCKLWASGPASEACRCGMRIRIQEEETGLDLDHAATHKRPGARWRTRVEVPSAGIECGDLSSLLFLGWSVSFTGLRGKLISVICSNLIKKAYNNSKTNNKFNYNWCIGRSVFFRPINHKT